MDKIANFSVNTNKNINDGKLYWNNQKSLNIDNVLNEIKLFTPQISFERKTDFDKRENPKISLVITLHNHEKNIKSLYASIQKQKLKDLEIIFVDDYSEDNTSSLITELMNIDKRIVYLKNDKNKGAFYSRNRGIISSKGEYLICLDADDLLLNNILIKAFETAKLYNLDIL
jgi:cellulose synthase/poly-beta-1,6-N-acetylglucosamine synthase-like glycosyltransferase